MKLVQNYSLRNLNTFGIDIKARHFGKFSSIPELETLIMAAGREEVMILGGGSNILFTGDFNGLVLKNEVDGIEKTAEDNEHVFIRVGAGVNWHLFVQYCIRHNYGGVENLSLIPGNTGASPMQNIGAYGVEVKDVFHELEAYDPAEKTVKIFNRDECAFGYRESVFKNVLKGRYIILYVSFRLSKNPVVNTKYGAIEEELEKMGIHKPGIADVSQAVINIRRSKLPDPAVIGNAGSFFKNPVIPLSKFENLKTAFLAIPGYILDTEHIKISAAWLIEQCGWKGYRTGDAGCHINQPLVLVNYGQASGKDILNLSNDIIASVETKFGVRLEREVNVVGGV